MHKEENGTILLDSLPVEILLTKKGVASIVRDDFVENPRTSYDHPFEFISFCSFIKLDDHYYSNFNNLYKAREDTHFFWSLNLKIEKNDNGKITQKTFSFDKVLNKDSKYFALTKKDFWSKGTSLPEETLRKKIIPFLQKELDEYNSYINGSIYTIQCKALEDEYGENEIPWILGNDIKKNGVLTFLEEIYVNFEIDHQYAFFNYSYFRDIKNEIFSSNNIISLIKNDFNITDLDEIIVISKDSNEEIFLKHNLMDEIFDISNETPLKTKIKEVLIEGYRKKYKSIF